ncbi:MAG: T9SS type A sorting domain-containing protein [Bacteroidia bacterium]
MKNIYILAFFVISIANSFAQQVTFQKTYGGTGTDQGFSVQQTLDSGYIIAGHTNSFGAGSFDFYLIKTDVNGNTLWTKTYGGINGEYFYNNRGAVKQTVDSGYIIAGSTSSFGAAGEDGFVIKIDNNGDTLWTKTYGGLDFDVLYSIQQTDDGGYIISGSSLSFVTTTSYNTDVYLIKTDGIGDTLWTKTYETDGGHGNSVQQTNDGGFFITGTTSTSNIAVFLIKTNTLGDTLWTKTLDGISYENGEAGQQTNDGGYIITGEINSIATNNDIFLIKTDANGDTLWIKTYGNSSSDVGYSVQQTSDDGYIIAGRISLTGNIPRASMIKTNVNGDTLWTKVYSNSGSMLRSVQQTYDGGYIAVGQISSVAGGVDIYLIKTDSLGNSVCIESSSNTIVTTTSGIILVNSPTLVNATNTIITSPATTVSGPATNTTTCTTVGIQSAIPNPQFAITISPNPATNNFTITFPNTIHTGAINIYNVLGEKIIEENILNTSQKEIHLNNIASGIYNCVITSENEKVSKKLAVIKE